jgi:hypothetical protein
MSQRVKGKTPEQTLTDYLDSIYLQSHSVGSGRCGFLGSTSGIPLKRLEKKGVEGIIALLHP